MMGCKDKYISGLESEIQYLKKLLDENRVQSTLKIVSRLVSEAYILLLINKIKVQKILQLSKNNCRI